MRTAEPLKPETERMSTRKLSSTTLGPTPQQKSPGGDEPIRIEEAVRVNGDPLIADLLNQDGAVPSGRTAMSSPFGCSIQSDGSPAMISTLPSIFSTRITGARSLTWSFDTA